MPNRGILRAEAIYFKIATRELFELNKIYMNSNIRLCDSFCNETIIPSKLNNYKLYVLSILPLSSLLCLCKYRKSYTMKNIILYEKDKLTSVN